MGTPVKIQMDQIKVNRIPLSSLEHYIKGDENVFKMFFLIH